MSLVQGVHLLKIHGIGAAQKRLIRMRVALGGKALGVGDEQGACIRAALVSGAFKSSRGNLPFLEAWRWAARMPANPLNILRINN
mmetsp:Transcript_33214/g.53486  ORF Transcript_33214/g.53486 Transcript_33214/m.53486 type:complete len:85 (-) Transcript_33214:73-327(-)